MRRLTAASEAKALGYGGVSLVSRACSLSRKAIRKGIQEIETGVKLEGRIRRPGGGRKPITHSDPQLVARLEAMIDAETRGDPESPLRWTCKSTRSIAAALTRRRHPISHSKVAQILHDQGYSLQGNRKTEEGEHHPDRLDLVRSIAKLLTTLVPLTVKLAIAECERLGREEFLRRYGYGHAREYVLRYGGRKYDSKAIPAGGCRVFLLLV